MPAPRGDIQLVRWLKKAGFKGEALRTAYGIVKRESGGNPRAYNGKGDDRSYGLAQINMLGEMGPARRRQYKLSSNDDLFDPQTNLRVMYRMSGGGKNFGPWGIGPKAYRQGAGIETIQKHLDAFDSAHFNLGDEAPAKPRLMASRTAQPTSLGDIDHRALALKSLQALSSGSYDPQEGLGLLSEMRAARETQRAAQPVQTAPPAQGGVKPLPHKGGKGINLQTLPWKETPHAGGRTSNLGWGDDEPVDIMGEPGTPVFAPSPGTVTAHGSAQEGGQSITIMGPDGAEYDYWLGHLDQLIPVGTKVKPGDYVGAISGEHPRPHVHATRRRRG